MEEMEYDKAMVTRFNSLVSRISSTYDVKGMNVMDCKIRYQLEQLFKVDNRDIMVVVYLDVEYAGNLSVNMSFYDDGYFTHSTQSYVPREYTDKLFFGNYYIQCDGTNIMDLWNFKTLDELSKIDAKEYAEDNKTSE